MTAAARGGREAMGQSKVQMAAARGLIKVEWARHLGRMASGGGPVLGGIIQENGQIIWVEWSAAKGMVQVQ